MAAERSIHDTIFGAVEAYRVVRVLGSGGMGDVYEVEDRERGDRFVLKTVRSKYAKRPDVLERFEREGRTLARLNHPNIVSIVRFDRTRGPASVPFYLMERLDGESLRRVLGRKPTLKLHVAIAITTDVLDALAHAHERKVVHRDIKPENVILHRARPGKAVAKLIDFGILKLLEAEEQQRLTAEGAFIGTYAYAPPEQIFGAWRVTPQSDLWSVAVLFFEMVTGMNPFTIGRKSDEDVVRAITASSESPRLSDFGEFPPPLVDWIASAMAKTPSRRPANAAVFADALRGIARASKAGAFGAVDGGRRRAGVSLPPGIGEPEASGGAAREAATVVPARSAGRVASAARGASPSRAIGRWQWLRQMRYGRSKGRTALVLVGVALATVALAVSFASVLALLAPAAVP